MTPTRQQVEIARRLNERVKFIRANGGDEALLLGLHDLMPPFKTILDTAQAGQMDELCRHFSDFHYLGQMLERMAIAIASGQIEVP